MSVAGVLAPASATADVDIWQFYLCILLAACVGLLLALLDDKTAQQQTSKGGSNPTAHLEEGTEALFGALSEDVGLGLLEPMWRLFTPEGALWTLCTGWSPRDRAGSLGVSGLFSSLGRLLGAAMGMCRRRKEGDEKLEMDLATEVEAYWGYFRLFALGVLREQLLRLRATFWRDEAALRFRARERWSSGWVEFYLQHMYKLYVDCFSRPIASAPDSCVEVLERERPGGALFGLLHELQVTGRTRRCVNLASYNYLGFGGVDKFCTPVAKAEALSVGFCSGAPRTEGGTLPVHRALEEEVAWFLGKEAAMVLGMGFATNSTVLPALFEAGQQRVLVLSDELNHRSIVEGVRLSGATVRAFKHNNMAALEGELQRAVAEQPAWRKIFIVVEGIYSMEGDFCRLREVVSLKKRYGAYLYLDEAHSIGAVGKSGRGVTELLGVDTSEVDVMMGTFTKSFGSAGGYVAASQKVVDTLRQRAPGSLVASAMSPPCAAQALAALRVISGKEGGDLGVQKLAQIRENANYFRRSLEEAGFKVLGDLDSPIIPVMLHHPMKLAAVSRMCLEKGVAVVVVGYPAVPVLYERVRFCISASHTREQLAGAMASFTEIGEKLGLLFEKSRSKEQRQARLTKMAEHANWLRSAPISEETGHASWRPEPLPPKFPETQLSQAALASVTTSRAAGLDLRLSDPLGYMARPLPAAKDAVAATMDVYGFGACGPRGFYGTTRPHLDLEKALAEFLGVDSAIAYSAGVATASSVLPSLIQQGDRVLVDRGAHLGIRTGLRLCKGAEVTWVSAQATGHEVGDSSLLSALESALASETRERIQDGARRKKLPAERRTFLVVEAICQRTGRLAPLAQLVELKERYGAVLILDESLSVGTLGAHGRGLCELTGVDPRRIDGIVGSLEHAFANVGGFCAGRKSLVEHQRLAGAGYCFSASCPPSACSGATALLKDLQHGAGAARLAAAQERAAALHSSLQSSLQGLPVQLLSSPESYMQHVALASTALDEDALEGKLLEVVQHCAEHGGVQLQVASSRLCAMEAALAARLAAPAAQPPTIRVCASAELSEQEVAAVGEALSAAFLALLFQSQAPATTA